jgi:hypothetical protein
MAYLGIDRTPCSKCKGQATVEEQEFFHPGEKLSDNPREVFLKCLECGHRQSYGSYRIAGNTLVRM